MRLFLVSLLAALLIGGTACSLINPRSQPAEAYSQLFQGIQYQRQVLQSPRQMVVHIVTIDLRQRGVSFLVTPGDPKAELPLKARTTSKFMLEFGLQLAINGDGFTPWHSNSPLDYYPHPGDPVSPNGLAASKGVVYAQNPRNHPVLYITRNNQASFNSPTDKLYNAISGDPMLVEKGKLTGETLASNDQPEPRTAVGLDKRKRKLIIILVDGRQPGYSEGATLAELAEMLVKYGAYTGMNLDGGGSSTLVVLGQDGKPTLLNSPIDLQIVGRERIVGNHLGIFAPPIQ
jgi:hypothetical protein